MNNKLITLPKFVSSNISNSIKKSPKRRKTTADLIFNVKSAVYLSISISKNYRSFMSFHTYIEKKNRAVVTAFSVHGSVFGFSATKDFCVMLQKFLVENFTEQLLVFYDLICIAFMTLYKFINIHQKTKTVIIA